MDIFDQFHNMTSDAENTIEHAESTVEIVGVTIVGICVICIMYRMIQLLVCVKSCICCMNPYRRV